jgi:hypothetical protein
MISWRESIAVSNPPAAKNALPKAQDASASFTPKARPSRESETVF